MIKVKTSELTGKELDWAVAKCEGMTTKRTGIGFVHSNGRIAGRNSFSTDWSKGGPIIEREKISIETWNDNFPELSWAASVELICNQYGDTDRKNHFGTTPLIAAMRCYVAYKLGDEVEIPAELVE